MGLKSIFRRRGQRIPQGFQEQGFKGLVKKYGWRVVLAVFMYYLIRDSILYILIPYLIAKGLFGG